MIRAMDTTLTAKHDRKKDTLAKRTSAAIDHAYYLRKQPDNKLKTFASEAARDKDASGLFTVLWAYVSAHSEGDSSQHTASSYERGVRLFIDFCNKDGVTVLRPGRQDGANFVKYLKDKKYAPKTVQSRLASVRMLYAALRWATDTEVRPFDDTKAPKHKESEASRNDKPYTPAEVDKMLALANDIDRVLVLLCGHGGLRVHEAVSLLWTKPGEDARTACYITPDNKLHIFGKGQSERTVGITPTLASALATLKANTPHKGEARVLPFTTVRARQRLQALDKQVGVTWRGVHGLRHFCGTQLYAKTRSPKAVMTHLGHANLATTDKYIAWADTLLEDTLANW